MLKKVAVLIPFYKAQLSDYESIALQQCKKVLSNHQIIAIKPHNFTLPAQAKIAHEESFNENYFTSIHGYNNLMLSSEFYERFLDYEYILIYQLDCFVFKDELNYWCSQSWDYIGSPWIKKTYNKNVFQLAFLILKNYFSSDIELKAGSNNQKSLINKVGNGGFSLRRVKLFHQLCLSRKADIDYYLEQKTHLYNEDVFWSIEVNRATIKLKIPPLDIALRFSFEVPAIKSELLTEENMPFGCHDWDHYHKYWKPIFKKLGYKI